MEAVDPLLGGSPKICFGGNKKLHHLQINVDVNVNGLQINVDVNVYGLQINVNVNVFGLQEEEEGMGRTSRWPFRHAHIRVVRPSLLGLSTSTPN